MRVRKQSPMGARIPPPSVRRSRRPSPKSGWSLFSVTMLLDQIDSSERTPAQLRAQLRALVSDDLLWRNLEDARKIGKDRRAVADYIGKRLSKVMG